MAPLFDLALWLAALGHFCILAASFQVPTRLGWRQELSLLRPFNRKLMWTYGGFTVLTIVAFGTLSIVLHDELLQGDRAALALAAFIGIYWTCRVAVDAVYFDHRDWPKGAAFVVGHVMLTALFVSLAATYLGLVGWQLLRS
jgi:alginate O-acetyltransferase complex protein AlgI